MSINRIPRLYKSAFERVHSDYQSALLINARSLVIVAIFVVFYLPTLYFISIGSETALYDSLALRLIGSFLCLGVALNDYCFNHHESLYRVWSYITFSYLFPFFSFYMFLMNDGHPFWLTTLITHYFYTKIIFDWVNTLLMWLIGISIAIGCYILQNGSLVLPEPLLYSLYLLPGIIFASIVFDHMREISTQQRVHTSVNQNLKSLAASIAHEMRNPLAQIHGNLYLIEELQKEIPYMYGAKPVVAQHINNAKRVIKNGLQVIDLTMDAIKDTPVNQDGFKLLSARAIVDEAAADYAYEEVAHAKLVSVEGDDFKLMAEPVMVKYVLYNLLQNALWYIKTRSDTEISISLLPNAGNDYHCIEVRDDGPGIPPAAIPQLFDSFYTSGKHGGTGLGLSYCKRTMNALGGDIHCHSELNQYTVFTLSFPVVSSAQQPQGEPNQEPQQTTPTSWADNTVLVVEDDIFGRKLTESMLRKLQIGCFTAKNGKEALEVLKVQRCDLILTDLHMPVINGWELTQRVRHSKGDDIDPLIPIIALSSTSEALIKTAIQTGVNDYLAKPVTLEKLLPKLRQWLPVCT